MFIHGASFRAAPWTPSFSRNPGEEGMAASGTRLLSSNRAGWGMAAPAVGLILLFIIVPFALAFGLSFTNQRLFSPNPTQWVGTANFKQLLGVGALTLEPEQDNEGAIKLDKDGEPTYPRLRGYTRNNPDYPQLQGMQEWFSFQRGDNRTYVLANDVVFMKALMNTFLFVLVVAPVQGGLALLLALMINQKLRGINFFRAVYFMPVVVSIVVVSLLWRFIYAGDNGLLNNVLSWVTFGAFRPVDWLGNTAVLVLIVITMQAFALFAQIDVMTQGGPLDSTQTMVFQAVERGYRKQDIAAGSVISVVLFLIVLSISLIQRYLTRERN
jgi:multiple sugar transport system permease protein